MEEKLNKKIVLNQLEKAYLLSLKIYIPKPKFLIRFKHCLLTLSILLPIASLLLLLSSKVLLISHFSFPPPHLPMPLSFVPLLLHLYITFTLSYSFTSLFYSLVFLPLFPLPLWFYHSLPRSNAYTSFSPPLMLLPHIPLLLYPYLCSPFPTSLLIFPLSCIFTYISHFLMSFLFFPVCSMHLPHFPLLNFYLSLLFFLSFTTLPLAPKHLPFFSSSQTFLYIFYSFTCLHHSFTISFLL